ncbi:MAG: hypothetical protein PUB28_08780 [Roseburia sp.]|nr:hypothetical protein [Roseburia sp.]
MQKMKQLVLNDGYIDCYEVKEMKSDFNAPQNAKKLSDMTHIVSLAYEEMSNRDQDLEFAETIGRQLSLKLKTHLYEAVNKMHKVVLNGSLYDIIKLDHSKKDNVMYFYLEEVRKIAE